MKKIFHLLFTVLLISTAFSAGQYDEFIQACSSSAVKSKVNTVAILPFEVIGDFDKKYGYFIADQLTHHLSEAGLFSIVERVRIESVIKENELSMSGLTNTKKAVKIGRLLSVDAVITGSAVKNGNQTVIIIKIISTETGVILKTAEVIQGPPSNPSNGNSSANAAGGGVTFVNNGDDTSPSSPSGGDSSQSYLIDEDAEISYKLRDVQPVRNGSTLYFIGEVENTGEVVIKKPDLQIVCYNSKKVQVAVVRCFAERNVYPGEKIPFRGILTKAPRFSKYEIVYQPEEDDLQYFITEFSVNNLKLKKHKTYSYYTFTGTLINNKSGKNTKLNKIIISMYDKNGKFVGHGIGFTALKKLKMGAGTPFKSTIYSYSMSGIASSYKLHFSAFEDK